MGTNKALLRLGSTSMIENVVAAAEKCGLPVRIIARDLRAPCGALGGIYTGLRTSGCDAVLFLACDMPLVPAEFLPVLMRTMKRKQSAIFTNSRGAVGFPLLIRKWACAEILQSITSNHLSLQWLARLLNAGSFHCSANRQICLLNVNTKEDFQCAQQHLASGLFQ